MTLKDDLLTAAMARELLHYDPGTGVLTWLPRAEHWFATDNACAVWNSRFSGVPAGCDRGRVNITIFYQPYLAHRVIWLMMTGEWPQGEIDHIDHNPSNNRWANLRDVSRTDNQRNQSQHNTNTSGVTGVGWHASKGKWRVTMNQEHIGYFGTFDEAVAARLTEQAKRGYHPNHGEPKKETAPNAER